MSACFPCLPRDIILLSPLCGWSGDARRQGHDCCYLILCLLHLERLGVPIVDVLTPFHLAHYFRWKLICTCLLAYWSSDPFLPLDPETCPARLPAYSSCLTIACPLTADTHLAPLIIPVLHLTFTCRITLTLSSVLDPVLALSGLDLTVLKPLRVLDHFCHRMHWHFGIKSMRWLINVMSCHVMSCVYIQKCKFVHYNAAQAHKKMN